MNIVAVKTFMKNYIATFGVIVTACAVVFAILIVPSTSSAQEFDFVDLSSTFTEQDTAKSFDFTSTYTKTECKINLSSNEIVSGGSVTVTWQTSGLSEIKINGEVVSGDSGSKTFDNITENTTFNLVGISSSGSKCKANVYLKCLPPPVVPKECELEITKSVNKTDAVISDTLTYTIIVKNIGDADCTGGGVKIEDVVDNKLSFVNQSISSNLTEGYGSKSVYTNSDRTLRWNGGTLTPGEKGTITWTATIVHPTSCGDFEIPNKARTTAKELNNFQTWVYSNTVKTLVDNDCVEDPLPSCDSFIATPSSITVGSSATLSWETTNATQVSINNGIGAVAVDGSISVTPLATITYTLTAIGANDKTVTCHVPVHVTDKPVKPECPFTPAPGRTIVTFTDVRLRSDQGVGNAFSPNVAFAIPAGTYEINLASWDGYNGRETVSQPNERWKLDFLNGSTVFATTAAIKDLPDNVRQAFVQEQVHNAFVLTTAATGVRAAHAVYPDTSSPNSLEPICASLDEIPEDPAPSCDAFTATPATITVGESATLAWETTNATRVVINNAIGEVAATGTLSVKPLVDTTYKMTVFGTNNKSVDCEVPVKVSEDSVPVCKAFTATPGTLAVGGGNVVLNWEVENASVVSISPTIGTVALVGSTTIPVTTNTTFTLTATDSDGDSVTCPAPVVVPTAVPFTCADNVSFSASDTSIRRGDNTTLNWNVTGADAVSISVIGATAFSGSQSVSPSSDTTYVLTATKGSTSIDCPVPVTVSSGGGGGGSSSPRCELEISDKKITLGETITLKWDTTRATEVTITDDRGNVIMTTADYLGDEKEDYFDGSIELKPTRDTKYTLVAERGSRDVDCKVEVELENNVVVLQTRDQQPLVAGISLSSVPYTGFEAGPFMTFMFYALLVAWAFYVTYLIVLRKRVAVTVTERANVTTMKQAETVRPDVFVQSVSTPVAPINLPTGAPVIGYQNLDEVAAVAMNPHQATDVMVTDIENRAHAQKALLSSDAVRHFVATTEGIVERNQALDEVISEAKKTYPLEDGWIVINESRMQNLCQVCKVNATEIKTTAFVPATVPEGTGSLAEAIVTGNIVAAYEMIGNRPMFALADAAADLDAVYRNRKGEANSVSTMLTAETAKLTDEKIKNMITALTGALDGTYTDEASAVKMAIMKAVKEVA